MRLSNTAQIRRADQLMIEEYGYPSILLMETAGRKCAEFILSRYPEERDFLILAGPGNNGGDGLVIARYLCWAGRNVRILYAKSPESYKGDAKLAHDALAGLEIKASIWGKEETENKSEAIRVDALLGTGIEDEVRGEVAEIIDRFRGSGKGTVAIDLPSGLNANTGKIQSEPLAAEWTLALQLPKLCHHVEPASSYCGEVVTVDLGILPSVLDALEIKREVLTASAVEALLPRRAADSHKNDHGHAALIGGTAEMAGAIALSAHAALHVGAGLSTAFIPREAAPGFLQSPEVMRKMGDSQRHLGPADVQACLELLEGKKALGIGPGMGQHPDTLAFLRAFLPQVKLPTVIDADGLNLLAQNPELWDHLPEQVILTPHPGEMARLASGDVKENRLEVAEAFAQEKGLVLVLKGRHSLICLPDGRTFVNPTGNAGMATAGAGDVLTGILTGLLAQGLSPSEAARAGVYLHGLAGDLAIQERDPAGLTAGILSEWVGKAIKALHEGRTEVLQSI